MNTNVETFEKLDSENVVVAITKDDKGVIVGMPIAYTPDMVTMQLKAPTAQITRLNAIKALFTA